MAAASGVDHGTERGGGGHSLARRHGAATVSLGAAERRKRTGWTLIYGLEFFVQLQYCTPLTIVQCVYTGYSAHRGNSDIMPLLLGR